MRYDYRAIDSSGRKVRGQCESVGLLELENRLRERGLDLVTAAEQPLARRRSSRMSRREWLHFWFQLKELLSAGVALQEALLDLAKAEDHRQRLLAEALLDGISHGATLSGAMSAEGGFNPVAVGMIRAGETAGRLPEAIGGLLDELQREDEMAVMARRVLIYPAFVAAVIAIAVFFLFYDLVPQLEIFLVNMGSELPWQTRLLFASSDLLREYGLLILSGCLLLLSCLIALPILSSAMRLRFDAMLLGIPLFGSIIRKVALARFAGAFSMLYASGISVLEALGTTRDISGNRAIRRALLDAEANIRAGRGISLAFNDTGLFPQFVVRMFAVGEATGALDRTLANVRHFYQREVEEAAKRAERLIEPVLTLMLGFLLGWIILAVIGPIYDVVANVGL
ncbi:MAG: type II secretion system F family protein [Betaproteobacteria bacterium]|nr:type II secretion system F family protein [Betaproteobacteria bacterium]